MPVSSGNEYFEVRASRDLGALGRRLKEAGDGELRKELLRRIRTSAKTAIPDIRASALAILPQHGGLAEYVAGQAFTSRTSLSASAASVRIVGQGAKELHDIDAGRVRHPVFGNRKVWSQESVASGFFSDPLNAKKPEIQAEIQKAMRDIANKVTRGL